MDRTVCGPRESVVPVASASRGCHTRGQLARPTPEPVFNEKKRANSIKGNLCQCVHRPNLLLPLMSQHSRKGDRRQGGPQGWHAFYSSQVQGQLPELFAYAYLHVYVTHLLLQFGAERWAALHKV